MASDRPSAGAATGLRERMAVLNREQAFSGYLWSLGEGNLRRNSSRRPRFECHSETRGFSAAAWWSYRSNWAACRRHLWAVILPQGVVGTPDRICQVKRAYSCATWSLLVLGGGRGTRLFPLTQVSIETGGSPGGKVSSDRYSAVQLHQQWPEPNLSC